MPFDRSPDVSPRLSVQYFLPVAARIDALYCLGHAKEAAILCAQARLFWRDEELLMFLKLSSTTLSKLIAIGAKILTCWPPSLVEKLKDQIELLYECTAHDVSTLGQAVREGELPGKKQAYAIYYLREKNRRDRKARRACREEALSELPRRFPASAACATPGWTPWKEFFQ